MKRSLIVSLLIVLAVGCTYSTVRIPARESVRSGLVLPEESRPYVVNGVSYYPLPKGEGFVQEGTASWYGREFHGKRTSSGETFDMYDKTAAHKTLPFGTYVEVKNVSNSKEVIVRINDRGPFVKNRVIDLAYGAAKEIGLVGPGTAPVRLVALSKELGKIRSGDIRKPLVEAPDFDHGKFTIQVGAFEKRENAERLAGRLRVLFDHVTITPYKPYATKTLHRVRVSLFDHITEAEGMVKELEYLGFSESFIVAL